MKFTILQPMTHVLIWVGVYSLSGVELFGCHHVDQAGAVRDFQPGDYVCKVSIENSLRAGSYSVTTGGQYGIGKASLFLVRNALRFEVRELSKDETPYPYHVGGIMNAEAKWEILREASISDGGAL